MHHRRSGDKKEATRADRGPVPRVRSRFIVSIALSSASFLLSGTADAMHSQSLSNRL